MYMEE